MGNITNLEELIVDLTNKHFVKTDGNDLNEV